MITLAATTAAQPPTNGSSSAGSASSPPRIVEVRVGLSVNAAESLSEQRFRRLLEIELDDSALLAPGTSGPLGDHVAYMWIDLPKPSRATIEVRVGERQVSRREISIDGLSFDVAGRIVAITASEMVRAQMRPVRAPRKPQAPKGPTPEELDVAARSADALTFDAGAEAAFLPASSGALGGPTMSIRFRRFGVSERAFASWLSGTSEAGAARWFEAGLGADYRAWLSSSWRFSVGAAASMALVRLGDVRAIDGERGGVDSWSSRASFAASLEARLHGPLWLGLALEPGAVLRPIAYEGASGAKGAVGGAWLGASLSLTVEWISPGQPSAAR